MAQDMASTARLEKPVRVDSPMEIDRQVFHQDTRPSRASTASSSLSPPPEHIEPEEVAHQRAVSMAKNRAASEDNANANGRMSEFPLRISTTQQPRAFLLDDTQACICTPTASSVPDKKVPRPCNSFILYRTHMQTETIREHPGLSNPQISKIIGEKWANEDPDIKAKWKKHAAEEAERHKQQHPGYQYKPKRKGSAAEPNTPKAFYTDGERCIKCNGFRIIPFPRFKDGPGKYDSELSSAATFEAQKRNFSHLSMENEQQHQGRRRSSSPILDNPSKRRRLPDTAGQQGVAPIQTQEKRRSQGHNGRMPASAGHDGRYHHVDTPLPHMYTMAPPPRPPPGSGHPGMTYPVSTHPSSAHPGSAQPGYQFVDRDGPMRLPPLQTAIAPSQSPSQAQSFANTPSGSGLGAGVDTSLPLPDQITTVPFARKHAVMGRVCPSLPRSTASPRGAIIAVEGSDHRSLEQVSQAVEHSLIVCRDAVVTAWNSPGGFEQVSIPPSGEQFKNVAPVIFGDILAWHAKSKEMVNFVTNKWISKSPKTADHTTQKPSAEDSNKIPVALIKNGFSVTHSDKMSCATTVALQNYNPFDHWQWMATIWRGIVGPDLTVYVKTCPDDEMNRLKTVEFQAYLNVMIVRVAAGKDLTEAAERRLNFEIIEWITDVWPRESARIERN